MIPIETLIKNRIDLVLNSVPEIAMVQSFPFETITWELASLPFCIFEVEESRWENRNRLERYDCTLSIETWFKIPNNDNENYKDRGIFINATIHKYLLNDCTNKEVGLGKFLSNIVKQAPNYLKPDEEHGVAQLFYLISFLTKYGDPFTQSNY